MNSVGSIQNEAVKAIVDRLVKYYKTNRKAYIVADNLRGYNKRYKDISSCTIWNYVCKELEKFI